MSTKRMSTAANILEFSGALVCFAVLFFAAQFVLQEKMLNDTNSYERVKLFYQEEHKPDVVFIGSSQVYYNINPLLMFREQGFTSYDFASPHNGGEVTVLYVKEALKTYSPKVIVVEALNISKDLMINETVSRIWLDPIPLTKDKIDMIRTMMDNNEKYGLGVKYDSFSSYIFPLLRYHGRWENISRADFEQDPSSAYYHGAACYHGFGQRYQTGRPDFSNYDHDVEFNEAVLQEMKDNFAEIVSLCDSYGAELLMIKTPASGSLWGQKYSDLAECWAEEYGIPFIDYYEEMDDLGLDMQTDFLEINHLNDTGATKLSTSLGAYLKENYDLPDHRDDPSYSDWEYDWEYYQQDRASYYLSNETDWESYLLKLQNPNYAIYIAAKDSLGGEVHPELTAMLTTLGLSSEVSSAGREGLIAVIDGGKVLYERLETAPLTYETDVHGHHIKMVSKGFEQGNLASIVLDGAERCKNQRGINILVYDNLLKDVVDSVAFDLYGGGNAYR